MRQGTGSEEPMGSGSGREDRQAEVDCVTERNRKQLQGDGPSGSLIPLSQCNKGIGQQRAGP